MLQDVRGASPSELAVAAVKEIEKSQFVEEILIAEKPRKFMTLIFQQYDGTKDPVDHLKGFQQQMITETNDEKLFCKFFPSSLVGEARTWFRDLKPGSISSFDELSEAFISQYFCNRKRKKDMAALFAVKQKVGERLKAFYERFRAEQAQTHGCTSDFAAVAFREGLLPSTQVYKDLVRRPAKDMGEIQTRIEGEIRLEEIEAAQASRMTAAIVSRGQTSSTKFGTRANTCGESKWQGEHTNYRREFQDPRYYFTVSPKQIWYSHMHEGIFSKPPPITTPSERKDQNRYCEFHEDYSHRTSQCRNLRIQIANLMDQGKLLQYRAADNGKRTTPVTNLAPTKEKIREIL